MAPRTAYTLLQNADGHDHIDGNRRWFLECLQQLNEALRSLVERFQPFRRKVRYLTKRVDVVPGRWRFVWSICTALLMVVIIYMSWTTPSSAGEQDILKYVDPLIGTAGGGHVFAGATLPFGMAKPVADVEVEGMAGFASEDSLVYGFSHFHDSGTGGNPSLGNFPLFVHPGCPEDDIEKCEFHKMKRGEKYRPHSVQATPGYFSIELESGVRAEMTATEHTALYKFSFLDARKGFNPVITADASDLLRSSGQRAMFVDAETGRMSGQGTFAPSFGEGQYQAYFCADFQGATPRDIGGFTRRLFPGATSMISDEYDAWEEGVYVRFRDVQRSNIITARVGLSWLSIDRACMNAEQEIHDWNFDRVYNNAASAWRAKLAPINVSSEDVAQPHLRNFWSGVYRAFLNPQDYTGENQLWDSSEPYYDSWYCIWDTFRGVHPFLTLIDPLSQSRMVRSLIDIYKHEGWLPDCRMSFCKGFTQGGSNADVIIADALVKKLPDINWTAAYEAVVRDAEEQPKNWRVQGRGGLRSWEEVGYIPFEDLDAGGFITRSISRTVEYAYNDFCIAQMANATGRRDDYEKYSARAGNWRNLFKVEQESLGFTNFPQPRFSNGTWSFQDATLCSSLNRFHACYLQDGGHETYEGSPWLYQFYVPQDFAALIEILGGRESFVRRLDTLHESGVLDMGDEQAFLTTYLYHYAGRPGLSVKRVHSYLPSLFNDSIAGIPGNDDSGSMGTFVFFSMLGIFPNAGQSVYFIIPPFFRTVQITNPLTGKTAKIHNVNFDPTYKRIYIQSATLNGKPYTKNWISHDFFTQGGTLELTLGEVESNLWGRSEDDVPPSLSTGLFLG